ncbi:MAG TPA: ACT domain-containing protein [Mycobacteriales bacterium]|nr:ACT domain-containing protein [Mycobacteriales bacterium]
MTGPEPGRDPAAPAEPAGRSDLRPRLDPTSLAVARYPAGWWPDGAVAAFVALVAAPEETTVVVAQPALADLPAPEAVELGWQRITFAGPLPWELVGFLADVADRLAGARIPFTSVSGFTTDHVLVRAAQAEVALAVLRGEPGPQLRAGVTNP